MKKRILVVQLIAVLFLLLACTHGPGQPVLPSGVNDVSPAPSAEATAAPTAEATLSDVTSAAGFLKLSRVIQKVDDETELTKNPQALQPGEVFTGITPNLHQKYNMLILDKEQSLKILKAQDLTEIPYELTECLPQMLRWDDVSVLDVPRYSQKYDDKVCRAYYYYLDDATVIIVNDAVRSVSGNTGYTKAWILVVPKGDESGQASWIPPKGTFVTGEAPEPSLYEPCYDRIRAYFMSDSGLPRHDEEFTPTLEDYMIDYLVWMKRREEHPEYYEKWKNTSFPPKKLAEAKNDSFRIDWLYWCEAFRDDDEKPVAAPELPSRDLPCVYLQVKQYGVPKEEMLEYVKWMQWSGAYGRLVINEEHVEALYSYDDDKVRRSLISEAAIYFEGKVYRDSDITGWVPAYDVARMFSREEFEARFHDWLRYYGLDGPPSERQSELMNCWDEYEKLRREDEGPLNMSSAVRVLNAFMEFYREVRYSPEVLAGELASSYDEEYFSQNEYYKSLHRSNKSIGAIREEMYWIFTPEMCAHLKADGEAYDTIFYSNQFKLFIWDWVPLSFLVSDLSKYYDGPIELFGDDYRLEDHIRIDSSDSLSAKVTLTARNRFEEGERTYSVELSKATGRWVISGGTIIELVENDETANQWG
ncbi:MAG: hypothetical protein ILO53_01880 [Clostridia bacterium]|nr:hypothetical protein [Clostridia bacterium]